MISVFTNLKHEMRIKKLVLRLSQQRVAMVLQPGNVWVFENSKPAGESEEADLMTCVMRGWIEPITDDIPHARVNVAGERMDLTEEQHRPAYRLTDSGWNTVHRTYQTASLSAFIALTGVIVSALSLG